MNSGTTLIALFGGLLSNLPTALDDEPVTIEARLFIESKGELSKDLLEGRDRYSGWNDGGFAAPTRTRLWGSGDILVVTRVDTAMSDKDRTETELRVSITNKGQTLAQRNVRVAANRGIVNVPVWLRDVTCAGSIRIEAAYGDKRKVASLNMACGE
jgi:hypothetical protein